MTRSPRPDAAATWTSAGDRRIPLNKLRRQAASGLTTTLRNQNIIAMDWHGVAVLLLVAAAARAQPDDESVFRIQLDHRHPVTVGSGGIKGILCQNQSLHMVFSVFRKVLERWK